MPMYEYRCHDCNKKQSLLFLAFAEADDPRCRYCGSDKLTRLISRVAVHRSEESRLESLADPSKWGDVDENDPKRMARFMKKMGRELGEDFGEDIDHIADEAAEESEKGGTEPPAELE